MELVRIEYFLIKKRSQKTKKQEEQAKAFRLEVEAMVERIREMGYEEESVEQVKRILGSPFVHPILKEETSNLWLDLIGTHYPDWKPVFKMRKPNHTTLDIFKEFLEREMATQEIVRIKTFLTEDSDVEPEDISYRFLPHEGWLKDGEGEIYIDREYVSVDKFIEEMTGYAYTKFGMPNYYNEEENTIWD